MNPHRGTLVLVLGILSLVICGPFLGVPAWIMGHVDLKAMNAGQMDASGRDLTKIGMILGIVTTVLSMLGILVFVAMLALGMIGAAGASLSR